MSMKSKLLVFVGVLAMLGIIALYVQEFQWFQNYINPRRMVFGALALGGLVGFGLSFYFQKNGEELVDKIRIWITCLIVPVLLMPLVASLTNRLFAERKVHETKVEFWEEKRHLIGRSPTIYGFLEGDKKDDMGYFIFVIINGELVRVKSKTPQFPNAVQGDSVVVPIKKGLLNVDFVDWQD
ncbi:MAG: hypothetical protein K9J37_00110 [Saprospiraceae bacterium]|nr:hypothetical protein [Saprospiraceae bacterium]MCF8248275.1 hypothetical protein [Saprospiraceae bacterium]MCF8279971.1 hypothetical protein [Bacteroidales bacterium]MCF8309803.1 hypothetical protein [Saprospiraceae bacterium]MCF8438866.1 hypothetical protein [Saprospiraceae bacterium]